MGKRAKIEADVGEDRVLLSGAQKLRALLDAWDQEHDSSVATIYADRFVLVTAVGCDPTFLYVDDMSKHGKRWIAREGVEGQDSRSFSRKSTDGCEWESEHLMPREAARDVLVTIVQTGAMPDEIQWERSPQRLLAVPPLPSERDLVEWGYAKPQYSLLRWLRARLFGWHEKRFYRYCKKFMGDRSSESWDSDSLAYMFAEFEASDSKWRMFFSRLPLGLDVYERLKQVRAADEADSEREAGRAATASESVDADLLLELAQRYLVVLRDVAKWLVDEGFDYEGSLETLTPVPVVRLAEDSSGGDPEDEYAGAAFAEMAHDLLTDWHGAPGEDYPFGDWMSEAFYTLESDYLLGHYVTWPWYAGSSPIEEPYESYFKLRHHGASIRLDGAGGATLHLHERSDAEDGEDC